MRITFPAFFVHAFLAGIITLLPATGRAEPPVGQYRVAFSGPAALSPLPSTIFVCDNIEGLSVCYSFRPQVDARGRISGTVDIQVDGFLDGTPVNGNFTAPLSGVIKGKTGDGVAPISKLKLIVRTTNVLNVAGAEREVLLKAKFRGIITHAATRHTLAGSRILKVADLGVSKGATEFPFDSEVDTSWELLLSLSALDASKLTGTAKPIFGGRELGEFMVKGTYSAKKQTSNLKLKSPDELKGASIKISNLDLSPDKAASFDVKYGLLGHKGRVSSTGGNAALTLIPDALPSEGAFEDPVDITDLLPYQGTVGREAPSYYVIEGVSPDTIYTILLQRVEGLANLLVPDDAGTGSNACGFDDEELGSLIECAMRSDGSGVLRFEVENHGGDIGARFELSFTEGGAVNQGTADSPFEITAFPFEGTALVQSYYRAVGLNAGAPYELSFSEATADISVSVYDSGDFHSSASKVCNLTGAGEVCALNATTGGEIFFLVSVGVDNGVRYTLQLESGGLVNQGSRTTPVDISGALPYLGTVSIEKSYYSIGGLTPGEVYTLTLVDISDRIIVRLFGKGWHFPNSQADCYAQKKFDSTTMECVGRSDSTGTLRIIVDGIDTQAGATYIFDDLVIGGLPNEGYFGAPVDVTDELPRPSTIYNSRSFYVVRNLSSSRSYTVRVSDLTDNVSLTVYADIGLEGDDQLCTSSLLGTVDESCEVTPTGNELFIWVSGPSSSLAGATFTLDVE